MVWNVATKTSDNSNSLNNSIANAYQTVLGRAPDAAGAQYWQSQISSGAVSMNDLNKAIANGAIGSDKAAASNWGSINNLPNIGSQSQAPAASPSQPTSQATNTNPMMYNNIINQAYNSIGRTGLGNDPTNIDQAGFDYWRNELSQNKFSDPNQFYQTFLQAAAERGDQNALSVLYGQPIQQKDPYQSYMDELYKAQLAQIQQQNAYQQKLYEAQLGNIGLNGSGTTASTTSTNTQDAASSYMNTPQTFSRGSAAGMGGVAKRRGWGGMYFA